MNPDDVPVGPLLVDTDVVSYWVAEAKDGESFHELVVGHELAVSFATYGELLANGHRARWGERRLTNLRNRLRSFVVLPYNAKVVELWAGMHAKATSTKVVRTTCGRQHALSAWIRSCRSSPTISVTSRRSNVSCQS